MRYTNIAVGRPSVNEDLSEKRVTPHECRLRDLTYSAPVYVDLRYQLGNKVVSANSVSIACLSAWQQD